MSQTPDRGTDIASREGCQRQPILQDADGYLGRLVRHWARRLVRQLRLPAHDWPDIEQELWLDLISRWPRFDASRAGAKTFAARIVQRRAATLSKSLRRSVRYRALGQLVQDEDVGDDDSIVAMQAPAASSTAAEEMVCMSDHEDRQCLVEDIRLVIRRLPAELTELCLRLTVASVSDVARQTGVSRASLYRRIHTVRAHFIAAEVVGHFFHNRADTSPAP